ncbi:extracellular alkaline serine protease [Colletotrichum paranaense]|uniref:Extracellular alkaline serine protease n=1 Tax=Colletotrichum paranaense TaxID=1914294 RepID=A0ABQ9SLK4_9PEZI|nr:extracellular alkaline serine protease [Colletotrichum paranaense]KAK1540415.1 extracellular alkaline serine protease [Colletotrichum paranaense]
MKEGMLPFSLKATDLFCKVVDELLQSKQNVQFFSLLHTNLSGIMQWLKDLSESPDADTSQGEILHFLILFENLLQWPGPPGKHLESLDPITYDLGWFPRLSDFVQHPEMGNDLMRAFASSPNTSKLRLQLLGSLELFSKRSNTDLFIEHPKLADFVQTSIQESDTGDYQYHLAELHRVLAMNSICQRRDEETAIGVLSKEYFCDTISHRQQAQLRLVNQGDSLGVQQCAPLSRFFCPQTSSIKLSEILGDQLTRKQRLTIAYRLANAVWQFYDSTWMRREWNKDTIHFMLERRGNTAKAVYVDEPFLSAHFHEPEPLSEDKMRFRYHPLPKVLALGIMMLEVELGLKIEDHCQNRPECYDADGNLTVNATHIIAMEIFKSSDLWEEKETFEPLKELIGNCLTADPFRNIVEHPRRIRDAIYSHVVVPLKKLYETAWGDFEKSAVRPIRMQSEGAAVPLNAGLQRLAISAGDRHRTMTMLPAKGSVCEAEVRFVHSCQVFVDVFEVDMANVNRSSAPTSDKWFDKFEGLKLVTRLSPSQRDASYAPARVAILDTGIDKRYSPSIVDFRDFVDYRNVKPLDSTGHGTYTFSLLQRVHPEAQVFVGRVFKEGHANDDTASIMAKAIRHAREVWKVDVIVMPSGFECDNEDMLRAIEEANAAHVLIFAAAANHGNLSNITFPGRLYRSEKTFCMFSTDGNARSLPAFNPSPLPGARNSFAILGQGIKATSGPPASGTSLATAIGAALAARIIDFSRHQDIRGRIRKPEHLKRVEGMASVFAKMARMDGGYQCIAPWRLLPLMEYEDLMDVSNRPYVRHRICEVISGALDEVYG